MAYAEKYRITFKSKVQNEEFYVAFMFKDYSGDSTDLKGTANPVTISYNNGDSDLLTPIQALEITISFLSDGSMGIEDYFLDDDEGVRVDIYHGLNLLWTGFVIQDGISERITDQNHVIELKATDNIGLLKNLSYADVGTEPLEAQYSLADIIHNCISATNLELNVRWYCNIYETREDDRSDDNTAYFPAQTFLYTQAFKDSDNEWGKCYDIIETILGDLNAVIFQANGFWNIVRRGEYQLFTDGEIPGTEFAFPDLSAITLDPLVIVGRKENNPDCYPIEANHIKTYQRGIKYAKEKFDYNFPPFIIQSDLQMEPGAIPYDTNTVGDLRYDDYSLATYFPEWIPRGGVDAYLEIVTDISVTPESEKDRYVVIVGDAGVIGGVQFNPISVTKGDKFDFSFQFRTDVDVNTNRRMWVRFVLVTDHNTDYNLTDVGGTGNDRFQWSGPSVSANLWDTGTGIYHDILNPSDIDTTEWIDWMLSASQFSTDPLPLIPEDGIVLIEIRGTNVGIFDRQTMYVKDIQLTLEQYINDSTQIVGQEHLTEQVTGLKLTRSEDVIIDDSPRNSIAGTLFISPLTNFDYTDINTGQDTLIGDLHFNRTKAWKRDTNDEALRLGEILTRERLQMNVVNRLIVEGAFRNFVYSGGYISMLSMFNFHFAPTRYFLPASLNIDLADARFDGRFIEIINTGFQLTATGEIPFEVEPQPEFNVDVPFDSVTGPGWIIYDATHLQYNGSSPWIGPFVLNISGGWVDSTYGFTIRLLSTAAVIAAQIVNDSPFSIEIPGNGIFYTGDFLRVEVVSLDGSFTVDTLFSITAMTVTSDTGEIEDPGDYSFKYIYENANN